MKRTVQILVVDDEPAIRESYKLLLQHVGHAVEMADGGAAALALLAQRKFDVVITDFSMPGMQGDELVARIRQRLPAQRIIMATAFAHEFRVFGQTDGHVDALLLKPFSFKDLCEAIQQVLIQEPPVESGDLPPLNQPSRPPVPNPLRFPKG